MNAIIKNEDKFNGKTYYKLNHKWTLRNDDDLNEIIMSIEYLDIKLLNKTTTQNKPIEHKSDENFSFDPNFSVIRVLIELQSKDWWFLHHGKLIFLADDNVVDLGKPVGRQSGTGTVRVNNDRTHVVCNEHCVYLLSKENLKKICNAKDVEIQLSGEKWKQENKFNKINIDYFRLFYNQVLDNSLYTEVSSKLGSFEKDMMIAKGTGLGLGCILPLILFIIAVFTYSNGSENGKSWLVSLSFILAIAGGIAFFILKHKARKKAS